MHVNSMSFDKYPHGLDNRFPSLSLSFPSYKMGSCGQRHRVAVKEKSNTQQEANTEPGTQQAGRQEMSSTTIPNDKNLTEHPLCTLGMGDLETPRPIRGGGCQSPRDYSTMLGWVLG